MLFHLVEDCSSQAVLSNQQTFFRDFQPFLS